MLLIFELTNLFSNSQLQLSFFAAAGSLALITFPYQTIALFTGRMLLGFAYGVAFTTLSMDSSENVYFIQFSIFVGMFSSFLLRKCLWHEYANIIGLLCCLSSALLTFLKYFPQKSQENLGKVEENIEENNLQEFDMKGLISIRLKYLAQFYFPLVVILMSISEKEKNQDNLAAFSYENSFNTMLSWIFAARNLTIFIDSSQIYNLLKTSNQIRSSFLSIFLFYCIFIFSSRTIKNVETVLITELIYQCLIMKKYNFLQPETKFQIYISILTDSAFHVFTIVIVVFKESLFTMIVVAWTLTISSVVAETFCLFLYFKTPAFERKDQGIVNALTV